VYAYLLSNRACPCHRASEKFCLIGASARDNHSDQHVVKLIGIQDFATPCLTSM
jgi:hypothetical protein